METVRKIRLKHYAVQVRNVVSFLTFYGFEKTKEVRWLFNFKQNKLQVTFRWLLSVATIYHKT